MSCKELRGFYKDVVLGGLVTGNIIEINTLFGDVWYWSISLNLGGTRSATGLSIVDDRAYYYTASA